jgi:hypothetical protein
MKVLVTGSRSWTNKEIIKKAIQYSGATTIIHGVANGADNIANNVALELGLPTILYPANWAKYGRSAGIVRNRMMLDREKPDLIVAFWNGTSRGTQHMIDYARMKGYNVVIYKEPEVKGTPLEVDHGT